MAKQKAGRLLSIFSLSEADSLSLYRQVYIEIRKAILNGNLERGMRLPSSRMLSIELGVSRNTIITAFEQLESEGFLLSQAGAGSYVAYEFSISEPKVGSPTLSNNASNPTLLLSKQGKAMMKATTPMAISGAPLAFSPGIPALDVFPYKRWNRCVNRGNLKVNAGLLNYGPTEGYSQLRNSLASYLANARGVRCTSEQIILVSGAQQALDLITRMLIDPGDPVWLEEPGHLGARGVFIAGQAKLIPVPVDAEGLDVEAGIARCKKAKLAYVTPSHQSPCGAIMSIQRRMQLLEWAQANGSWIIEDDYDSEFRYKSRPLAALQGLNEGARVLYLGTFSKVLAPGLRLGYLVVPENLVDVFSAGRRLLDTHTSVPLQLAINEFISRGYFSTHIRRMRQIYHQRQSVLVEEVNRQLSDWVTMSESSSGMHLVGDLNTNNDRDISASAIDQKINVPALSDYYLESPMRSGLLFGYACTPPDIIRASVKKLKVIFANEQKDQRTKGQSLLKTT